MPRVCIFKIRMKLIILFYASQRDERKYLLTIREARFTYFPVKEKGCIISRQNSKKN